MEHVYTIYSLGITISDWIQGCNIFRKVSASLVVLTNNTENEPNIMRECTHFRFVNLLPKFTPISHYLQ